MSAMLVLFAKVECVNGKIGWNVLLMPNITAGSLLKMKNQDPKEIRRFNIFLFIFGVAILTIILYFGLGTWIKLLFLLVTGNT